MLDATEVTFAQEAPDRVRVEGARAAPRTATYKVSVGYRDGWLGEGQISYGGPGAVARAHLAGKVVGERLKLCGFAYDELRIDLIGIDSLHGPAPDRPEPYEVRLRVAGRSADARSAEAIGWEVDTLYTNGPQGGAGASRGLREIYAVQSVLLARERVRHRIETVSAP